MFSGLITSIIRFVLFWNINGQSDATWAGVKLGLITVAEPGVYLIAACLPTYRHLFRSVKKHTGLSTGRSRSTYGRGTYGSGKSRDIELSNASATKYTVTGTSNGFSKLDSEELIPRGKEQASTEAHQVDEEEEIGRELGKEIHVQSHIWVESRAK
jgi:hypothetical protein